MECVWIPKARSTRKSEGASRLRNGPSESELTDENAWKDLRRRGGNINEQLMKINVREEVKCGRWHWAELCGGPAAKICGAPSSEQLQSTAAGVKAAEGVR
ncbi:MAG: hypothetical protein ACTS4T_01250 [Candidatus Hodgkinia cicadicola]